jgi:hypothetical protein
MAVDVLTRYDALRERASGGDETALLGAGDVLLEL